MNDRLSTTLSALADPTRRGILARLAKGEASVSELAEPYDMSLAAVSKHLKVLENAGLISRGKQAQWRPCKLEAAPMAEVADWVESYPPLLGPEPRSPRRLPRRTAEGRPRRPQQLTARLELDGERKDHRLPAPPEGRRRSLAQASGCRTGALVRHLPAVLAT